MPEFKVRISSKTSGILFDGEYATNKHWLLMGCFVTLSDKGMQALIDSKQPFTYNIDLKGGLELGKGKYNDFSKVLPGMEIGDEVKLTDTKISFDGAHVLVDESKTLLVGVSQEYSKLLEGFSIWGKPDCDTLQIRTYDGKTVVGLLMQFKLKEFNSIIREIVTAQLLKEE